jgi:hypothetical protein
VPLTALGKDDETKSCAPLVAEIRKGEAKAPAAKARERSPKAADRKPPQAKNER